MSRSDNNVLAFFAHPDDAEFLCAGTLARLKERGCRIQIATMTAGDGGSAELPNAEIARIRLDETARAAALLEADYQCAGLPDFFFNYDAPTLRRVIEIIRQVNPAIVFTHSPDDYMVDHETASRLVRAACFAAPAPNAKTGAADAAPPIAGIPHLYYADPLEGKDILGRPIAPGFYVDVSGAIELKAQMLACHTSQREWLRVQHGMDHYLESMREWAAHRGAEAGVPYAEAFRQHLGHAYPQNNRLTEIIGVINPTTSEP
ncbi:MAG TPA: PIG-L family deacetylase [Blastocatellia bacterium]|nr:PIG-L family deacetylase [Blastocatellia bacterium]